MRLANLELLVRVKDFALIIQERSGKKFN